MSKPISSRARRTYFSNPLIEESLQYLGAAVDHPTSVAFREYLANHLHHNSQKTRARYAEYISQRFSYDGVMNSGLARAIRKFGDSRVSREILYFELLRSTPLLQEIASLWLAELPSGGVPRAELLAFLDARLGGRSAKRVAKEAVAAFRRCNKLTSPKPAIYVPVWAEPPIEAFCYVLASLYPEPAMTKVDLFAGLPILRAMLWPQPAIEGLLKQAEQAGHVSKISELDQYHQFTLAGTGRERLSLLLGDDTAPVSPASSREDADPRPLRTKPKPEAATYRIDKLTEDQPPTPATSQVPHRPIDGQDEGTASAGTRRKRKAVRSADTEARSRFAPED